MLVPKHGGNGNVPKLKAYEIIASPIWPVQIPYHGALLIALPRIGRAMGDARPISDRSVHAHRCDRWESNLCCKTFLNYCKTFSHSGGSIPLSQWRVTIAADLVQFVASHRFSDFLRSDSPSIDFDSVCTTLAGTVNYPILIPRCPLSRPFRLNCGCCRNAHQQEKSTSATSAPGVLIKRA